MRRYLLSPVFFVLFGCSAVAFAFAMNLFTGGTLPDGWSWYEPWSMPVLVASVALTIAFPMWQYLHAQADRQGLLGRRTLTRAALRRYQAALGETCSKLALPFVMRPAPQLRDVYVPLRAVDEHDHGGHQVDAAIAIAGHRRVLILGSPGSGKTMLLKQTALSLLKARSARTLRRGLPLLLELSRLNEPSSHLQPKLAERLGALAKIEQPAPVLQRLLDGGRLLLLLDGLDEVAASRRQQVAREIRDLLDAQPSCRVVITCRSAVYDHGLRSEVDRTFQIAEFDDDRIRRFLGAWPGLDEAGADLLMSRLLAAPKILALIRNPLLLTLLAYLYAPAAGAATSTLPRSRVDFYKDVTDVLLRRWRQEQHRFSAQEKRAVLERLALWAQDHHGGQGDWQGMPYRDMLSETAGVLPAPNRDRSEAQAIIDEIVEHSALLLRVDAGDHYQFAHLTMQEYFAASALLRDPHGLVRRYLENSERWREPLLLWCGDARDATDAVEEVFAADPLMALECLDSAQRIEPALAERIIEHFKAELLAGGDADSAAMAFGAMAGGDTAQARAARAFLVETLEHHASSARQAVALAVAATGLPSMALLLAKHLTGRPEIRSALIHMGGPAIPVLLDLAKQGKVDAFDCLQAIGTLPAAEALASLLWTDDQEDRRPRLAAQRLAALLDTPSIEAGLIGYRITSEQQRLPRLPRLSELVAGGSQPDPVTVIAGRVDYLLQEAVSTPGDGDGAPTGAAEALAERLRTHHPPVAPTDPAAHGQGLETPPTVYAPRSKPTAAPAPEGRRSRLGLRMVDPWTAMGTSLVLVGELAVVGTLLALGWRLPFIRASVLAVWEWLVSAARGSSVGGWVVVGLVGVVGFSVVVGALAVLANLAGRMAGGVEVQLVERSGQRLRARLMLRGVDPRTATVTSLALATELMLVVALGWRLPFIRASVLAVWEWLVSAARGSSVGGWVVVGLVGVVGFSVVVGALAVLANLATDLSGGPEILLTERLPFRTAEGSPAVERQAWLLLRGVDPWTAMGSSLVLTAELAVVAALVTAGWRLSLLRESALAAWGWVVPEDGAWSVGRWVVAVLVGGVVSSAVVWVLAVLASLAGRLTGGVEILLAERVRARHLPG